MKHEEWKIKEKIIRIVTEALLLTNTWQAHHSSFFHSDWSDSPDYENKDTENITAQKRQKTTVMEELQQALSLLEKVFAVFWNSNPTWNACIYFIRWFYSALLSCIVYIYIIPVNLNYVHTSTCYGLILKEKMLYR